MNMILSDISIEEQKNMISPFVGESIKNVAGEYSCISYGLSSYGYDVRLACDIQLFSNLSGSIIDPKDIDPSLFIYPDIEYDQGGFFILPPNSYALGHTIETFDIPRDIMVLCVGKSTYARAGIHINITPIEPGFKGQVVIEMSNATNSPAKIYIEEGIAQFLFLRGDKPCATSYGDRDGKYQDQRGITHAKV